MYEKSNSFQQNLLGRRNFDGLNFDKANKNLDALIKYASRAQPSDAIAKLSKCIEELAKCIQGKQDSQIFNLFDLDEFSTLPEENLVRYVLYRYRYKLNPANRVIEDYPPCVQIEPTSICNLRCKFCYQVDDNFSNKKRGFMGSMEFSLFKKVIDEIEGNVEAVTFASRGEPTLAPKFRDMMSYCKNKFVAMKINTNATKLPDQTIEAMLDANPAVIVFSMDSGEKAEYERMRVNAKYADVVKNIERVMEIKNTIFSNTNTKFRVSGVGYPGNSGYQSLVDVFGDMMDQVALVDYVPWIDPYSARVNTISQHCSDLWRRMFVYHDGSAGPCDVDYLQQLPLPSISDLSVKECWGSEEYQSLRRLHATGKRSEINVCSRCSVV